MTPRRSPQSYIVIPLQDLIRARERAKDAALVHMAMALAEIGTEFAALQFASGAWGNL